MEHISLQDPRKFMVDHTTVVGLKMEASFLEKLEILMGGWSNNDMDNIYVFPSLDNRDQPSSSGPDRIPRKLNSMDNQPAVVPEKTPNYWNFCSLVLVIRKKKCFFVRGKAISTNIAVVSSMANHFLGFPIPCSNLTVFKIIGDSAESFSKGT